MTQPDEQQLEIFRLRKELRAALSRAAELEEAIRWALGEGPDDFAPTEESSTPLMRAAGVVAAFWWRPELRKRAGLLAPRPTLTTMEGDDRDGK